MKTLQTGFVASAAIAIASSATGAGLDRSFQSISPIFNESGTLSFSHSYVMPSVGGTDSLGAQYDVAKNYSNTTAAYTHGITDQFTLGFIVDQPFGADIFYNGDPLTTNLAGTAADFSSEAFTLLGKYQINDRFSVIGGLKAQRVKATVNLNGVAYARAISTAAVARGAGVDATTLGAALQGDLTAVAALGGPATVGALGAQVVTQVGQFQANNGYTFNLPAETEYGWVIGAAYEIPDIAFRLAFTYHSEIEYSGTTTEAVFGGTGLPGTVDYVTPESLNIEFQTGIAQDTLLLASYRWTAFEDVDVIPTNLQSDLVNLEHGHRYTLGVGRRFTDEWSGTAILSYEPKGSDDLVSPLGPTNGLFGITLGARYETQQVEFTGGINYSWLGDARPEVANVAAADFSGNSSVAIGFNIKYTF